MKGSAGLLLVLFEICCHFLSFKTEYIYFQNYVKLS